jgi:tol-pal system protein YbgF
MEMRRTVWIGAAFAFLLGGCAAETSEFKSLREQVRLQQKQIVDLKSRQEQQQAKLEILDNGFRIVGDKVEENALRLDDMGSSGSAPAPPAPVVSRPRPIAKAPVEMARPIQPAPAVRPAPAPPPPPKQERVVVTPPLSAADLYRSALDSFTRENYPAAILEFQEFVANHPDHDLADNAQYWIGECYYAQKNFALAAVEFDKVEKHFGSGNKVAAALLKRGLALRELNRNEEAVAVLETVVIRYPAADEAAIAKKRLTQWR